MAVQLSESSFPAGIVIDGSLSTARPVGTIVFDTTTRAFYRSTDDDPVTYAEILLGALAQPVVILADPGTGQAIPVDKSYAISFTVAAGIAETNTLAIPTFLGQQMLLCAGSLGAAGTRAITVASAINQAANTVITFNTVRDFILLEAVQLAGALAWRVIVNDGTTLS